MKHAGFVALLRDWRSAGRYDGRVPTASAHSSLTPPRRLWVLVWLLPLLWGTVSYFSLGEPGDEYALFAVSSVAGIWIFAIVEDNGTPRELYPWVLGTGALTIGLLGLLLDLLRVRVRWWLGLWVVVALAFFGTTLANYPSYQRAIAKNGSLGAYIYFSLNAGLTATTLIMLPAAALAAMFRRRPKAGCCRACGYNLTGNTSGICPECGSAACTEPPPPG